MENGHSGMLAGASCLSPDLYGLGHASAAQDSRRGSEEHRTGRSDIALLPAVMRQPSRRNIIDSERTLTTQAEGMAGGGIRCKHHVFKSQPGAPVR